ncbi:MAG: NADH-ubiquinone oxidoreductase-F iron-sulfur binding region domain-containing protein [Eubacteriales bacterium]|nr:NADH-ubiquinone oxidoreductase-F iron-sulfur binding region domain-containing protein [Eubacteriales bacterium]
MQKLRSHADLKAWRTELQDRLSLRSIIGEHVIIPEHISQREILVCGGTGCKSSDSSLIIEKLRASVKAHQLDDRVKVVQVGCFGFCAQGPIVKVDPDNVLYVNVHPSDVEELVSQHLVQDIIVERLLYVDPKSQQKIHHCEEMDFYKKQHRVALRNCGKIDPETLEDYIAAEGYEALAQCLFTLSPQEVIEQIKASGLRGRGGGGFPTGLKWELCAKAEGQEKYIICNADEGDPGAFMDRSILEGDPGSVLEAMAIAGYAIGANYGLVYIRAEYPLAVHRLEIAIREAEEAGLLGENILGSGFDFKVEINLGAGAFVCGEETALIHSLEGGRGEPTRKPPFPAQSGYRGKPSNVNNVETYANIPVIILQGPEKFAQIGTEKSKGTKVFALAGKVNNIGLVEVPMGTSLREIVYEIGGGIPEDKAFKAVQTGGPSGGVITDRDLDTEIDYESLMSIGSMMGSGGMIVMNEDNDMVKISKFYLDFITEESCGKCTPCRIGTKRLQELLADLLDQKASEDVLEKIARLCYVIKDSALCGLGQTAPNPVLSTMKFFPEEYERYAKKQVSRAYAIDPQRCIGCGRCKKACPVQCISGEIKHPHKINPDLCIACGACFNACPLKPTKAVLKPGQQALPLDVKAAGKEA